MATGCGVGAAGVTTKAVVDAGVGLRFVRLRQRCPRCGATMRLIAFIVERAEIVRILDHLGEPTAPPRAGPIRDPPEAARAWAEGTGDIDAFALEPNTQHIPDYENQRQDVDW